ncbi:MAG: quinol:cytochrome C oxidoreductase [Planctomycetes bacterium]|nr:quinol:cytochrome C oxidoreductase [Planctomycetota bacterium]
MTAPPIEQVAPHVVTKVRDGDLKGAQMGLLGAGIAMLALSCAFGMFADGDTKKRFFFSYLVGYMGVLGICLAALFFTMLQHITRAGWSVVVRRIAENVAAVLPFMLLLFLPIVVGAEHLFHHWWHPNPADTVLAGKKAWLDSTFFFVRVGIYFAIWLVLAWFFRKQSLLQDQTGDPTINLRLARLAAPGLLLFALSITFAAFDWIMSLDPHWFSTIFGLTYFAGAFMSFLAFTVLFARFLGSKGYLKDAITTEHYHDLGKLLFAFMVFWTYTNFSQYMLIWYANLPEETAFFEHRHHGGWGAIGTLLIFGHFFFPFAFLMSRHVKRHPVGLAFGAIFMLVMHWVDMQFLIVPNFHPTAAAAHAEVPHAEGQSFVGNFTHGLGEWMHGLTIHDFLCFFGMLSFVAGMALLNMRKTNLLPTRDPRLAESLHFVNI